MAADAFTHPETRQHFEFLRTDGNLSVLRSSCRQCGNPFEVVALRQPDFRGRAFGLVHCASCRRGSRT